jgi:hypothetical protein
MGAATAVGALGVVIGSCGAVTELDEERNPTTPEEACEAADGAEWRGDGCGGAADWCSAVCEATNGIGCHCPTRGECWDGTRCVVGSSYENSFEADDVD